MVLVIFHAFRPLRTSFSLSLPLLMAVYSVRFSSDEILCRLSRAALDTLDCLLDYLKNSNIEAFVESLSHKLRMNEAERMNSGLEYVNKLSLAVFIEIVPDSSCYGFGISFLSLVFSFALSPVESCLVYFLQFWLYLSISLL